MPDDQNPPALERGGAPPAYFEFLVPAQSARIVDNWYAAGLAASLL